MPDECKNMYTVRWYYRFIPESQYQSKEQNLGYLILGIKKSVVTKFHKFWSNLRNFWNTLIPRKLIHLKCPELFLRKGVLKIRSKIAGEHPCQSAISIKLPCNFIEITLQHGCSPVNLLHLFRTPFPRNTSGWLLPKELANDILNVTGSYKITNDGKLFERRL